MDSDDEDILQYERQKRMDWDKAYIKRYKGDFPTRLYEREEQQYVSQWASALMVGDAPRVYTAIDDLSHNNIDLTYRVSRFCETVKGFHVGGLDLAGRHEHRYLSIRKRWDVFVKELANLFNHMTESEVVLRDHLEQPICYFSSGRPMTETVVTVEPPSLFEEFQEKWQIKVHGKASLRKITDEVQACLAQYPIPKFQVMNLLDLPTELLYEITASAGVFGARALGAACRRLRTISLPYVFKSRRLELKIKKSLPETNYELDEVRNTVRNWATTAREALLQEIEFLLSREDITACVEVLSVHIWDSVWFDNSPEHNVLDFLLPISPRLQEVVTHMPNLREIFLVGIVVTEELKRALLSLPSLFRLELLMCKFTESSNRGGVPSSLPNLHVIIEHDETEQNSSVWTILPWLTNLRWLSLSSAHEAPRLLPSLAFSERPNPFVKLETVVIKGMDPWECADLIEMLNDAVLKTEGVLPLTRLKLSFTYGISGLALGNLLSALESSSLQFFIVDGLTEAPPDIIDDIARTFPNLQSLTLAYRDSNRQHKCGQVVWPFATWEYARQFAGFSCLTHFGWNLEVDTVWSPATMQWFEDEFPMDWWNTNTEEVFEPVSSDVVKLFASYCPSLRSMSFLIRGAPFISYFIHREANGQISVTEAPLCSPEMKAHNPFVFSSSDDWPLIRVK